MALILADAVLAKSLGRDHLLPLLALALKPRDLRKQGHDLRLACHRAVVAGARQAVPLAADLARAAARLKAVAPKLRAKGADRAVDLFLMRDALAPAALASESHGGMSDRAARRPLRLAGGPGRRARVDRAELVPLVWGLTMARDTRETGLDRELADLPPELRWREGMRRIEAVLFASATPVSRNDLARVVGQGAAVACATCQMPSNLPTPGCLLEMPMACGRGKRGLQDGACLPQGRCCYQEKPSGLSSGKEKCKKGLPLMCDDSKRKANLGPFSVWLSAHRDET